MSCEERGKFMYVACAFLHGEEINRYPKLRIRVSKLLGFYLLIL